MVSVKQKIWPSDLLSDEPELESNLHLEQIILLLTCLKWLWQDRNDFFAAGNMSIYYDLEKLRHRKFRGPDFFVVLNTERKDRNSWMVWEENYQYPNLIVEILSPKTARVDRGFKKILYQNTFKTQEYFWFDPKSLEFQGFKLTDGEYAKIEPTLHGGLWSEELKLYLGLRERKLRYFTPDGALVPNFEEETARQQREISLIQQRVELESQRAELESQRAELESQRAQRFADQLRALGINPEEL